MFKILPGGEIGKLHNELGFIHSPGDEPYLARGGLAQSGFQGIQRVTRVVQGELKAASEQLPSAVKMCKMGGLQSLENCE